MSDDDFCRRHRRALIEDRVSGASQLARRSLDCLAEYAGICETQDPADLRRTLVEFAEVLQYARPSMAPIYNMIQRWVDRLEDVETNDTDQLRREAGAIAQSLADQSLKAVSRAADHAAKFIGPDATVITHSLSSSVTETFRLLAPRGVKAIASEARPGYEGRQQAVHLDHAGIPVTLVTDAQLGHFAGHASVALVGADTLLADGSVINKVGTSLLALAAREHGIPFYVCCESFKAIPFAAQSVELEEADPGEIDAPRGKHITPMNLYFDVTPARLISAWITDEGVSESPPSGIADEPE